MINQTRNRNESERIASRRGGRKKYHGKNQVRPPVGREKQSVGRWGVGAGVGGGGRCGGRALGGRACAQTAGGAAGATRSPAAHSQRPRRSSPASRSAPPVRAPLASTPRRALTAHAAGSVRVAAAAARHYLTWSQPLYMSKVLKSVLPIATARVIPQPIYEPDPSCTPLRVSTQTSLTFCAAADRGVCQ